MIFVEDNSDQYLLEYLNKPSRKIWRAEGKQDVVKKVRNENSIGIIDFDDSIAKEIEGMSIDEDHKHLLLYKKSDSFLVVFVPRLQNWLVSACNECQNKPSSFGLPDKVGELHNAINKEVRKQQFLNLLMHLNKNSQMFQTYKQIIKKINHK